MRAIWLSAAGALLLGGCGPTPAASDDPSGNVSPAPPSMPEPPAASGPEQERSARAIPAQYHGVYDGSAEACARPSDQRLAVTANALRFHESIGTVRAVTVKKPGIISVESDYQGEGERWQAVNELILSDGGATLTVAGDDIRLTRVRCPAGAR